jgi:hypothetical protein
MTTHTHVVFMDDGIMAVLQLMHEEVATRIQLVVHYYVLLLT